MIIKRFGADDFEDRVRATGEIVSFGRPRLVRSRPRPTIPMPRSPTAPGWR